ncbi:hypothetical protein B0H66DRAFT_236191 [Apodospora peruviana]|uniref:Transcription initiation factor IIF subunit alpha n=1 Tax=Apodospora peruviana TaxID=516989 RepID=A0AAE0I4G2_9PEZI|nr:hypothetical protein B0H66DRAFT_236191 [Apodospora peruviana]
MSAPTPGPANGLPKPQPAAASLLRRRPKPAGNPMVARRKPAPKPLLSRPPPKSDPTKDEQITIANGANKIKQSYAPKVKELEEKRQKNGGWSEQPPPGAQFHEFPLVTTKRALREGIRHHIMRLTGRPGQKLDVTDQDQFPRPVTLHRRDPRLPPAYRMNVKVELEPANPADDAEAERLRQQKAERDAQRERDQALIAPVVKNNEPKQKQTKKDKVSAFYGRNSDAQKKQSGLRYEETLPWHLEDADGTAGVWVGSYIAGLSDLNCALVIDGPSFRMIPLERYYKFDEKPRFDTLSLDDAEKMMLTNKDVKRWVMRDVEKQNQEKEKSEYRSFLSGRPRIKTESATSRNALKTEKQDDQDIDMSGDEFQDDDETPGFEAEDEDAKEAKERVRREQVAANLFGAGEESKVDEEERERQIEKLKLKTIGKTTKKKLMKLEHAMDYDDSDSENDNPFTDNESESESEPEEKKDEAKKEEEARQSDSKDASGATPMATDTPPGKGKNALSKKGKLKRPGSPNLSDSSGNESSRKKVKTSMGTSSKVPSRSGTPLPGRPKGAGGATSDGEATAGEGSDGGLKLKKKIKIKSTGGSTPSASRAGSPAPAVSQNNNKSPTKAGTSTPSGSPAPSQEPAKPPPKPIEAWEVAEVIRANPNGISLVNMLRKFHSRLQPQDNAVTTKHDWMAMVKRLATLGPDKLLRPIPGVEQPTPP